MKFLIIFIAILATTAQANQPAEEPTRPIDCRQAIVDAHDTLQDPINPRSFSSMPIEDFTLSAEQFNNLDPRLQAYYYQALKPISLMVDSTIGRLNSVINFYAGNQYFRDIMIDALAELRARREALRTCN